jgi:hypothetical protein
MFSRLQIGHRDYSGTQFVYCRPFKMFHDLLRMDYVFFVPPLAEPFYRAHCTYLNLTIKYVHEVLDSPVKNDVRSAEN